MTPRKAALDAATDQVLAASADLRREGGPPVAAVLPIADRHADAILAQFKGHEEVAGRVLAVAAGMVPGLTAGVDPDAAPRVLRTMLGLIGERVCREGGRS